MSQSDLDREVSRRTGESLRTIRRHGFSIVPPPPASYEPEPDDLPAPQCVDWDEIDAQRRHAA